jgi:hypothetical protein
MKLKRKTKAIEVDRDAVVKAVAEVKAVDTAGASLSRHAENLVDAVCERLNPETRDHDRAIRKIARPLVYKRVGLPYTPEGS